MFRIVPLNLGIHKTMVLNNLFPRIEMKCSLNNTLKEVFKKLKSHLTKKISFQEVIGHENQLKLAPDKRVWMNKLDDDQNLQDKQRIPFAWTQNNTQFSLKDLYFAMNNSELIYLYDFWEPRHAENEDQNQSLLLDGTHYEEFLSFLTKVVEGVYTKVQSLEKKKKRKKIKTQQTQENQFQSPIPPPKGRADEKNTKNAEFEENTIFGNLSQTSLSPGVYKGVKMFEKLKENSDEKTNPEKNLSRSQNDSYRNLFEYSKQSKIYLFKFV